MIETIQQALGVSDPKGVLAAFALMLAAAIAALLLLPPALRAVGAVLGSAAGLIYAALGPEPEFVAAGLALLDLLVMAVLTSRHSVRLRDLKDRLVSAESALASLRAAEERRRSALARQPLGAPPARSETAAEEAGEARDLSTAEISVGKRTA